MTESEKLEAAIRTALDLPQDMQLAGIAYGKTDGWDSVAHMQLVAAIENAFGIMLETEDVIAMNDFDAICMIVRAHHDVAADA